MQKAGFSEVRQYIRLNQLPLENLGTREGALAQVRHGLTVGYGSATGLTSIVVAHKSGTAAALTAESQIAESLLDLSAVHDRFIQNIR
jgi:hypothetical protein